MPIIQTVTYTLRCDHTGCDATLTEAYPGGGHELLCEEGIDADWDIEWVNEIHDTRRLLTMCPRHARNRCTDCLAHGADFRDPFGDLKCIVCAAATLHQPVTGS